MNIYEKKFKEVYSYFPEFTKEDIESLEMNIATTNYIIEGDFYSNLEIQRIDETKCLIGGRFDSIDYFDANGNEIDFTNDYENMLLEFKNTLEKSMQVIITSQESVYYATLTIKKIAYIDEDYLQFLFIGTLAIEEIEDVIELPEPEYDRDFIDCYIKENGGDSDSDLPDFEEIIFNPLDR